jgi:uncharacterized membrane protein
MKSNRLEAFSDGVLAIIITIMVLELKAPEEISLHALFSESPIFVSYLLSFIYLGIYWNNHHHLFQITEKVNGKILWANLHLLFWLSLIPFATSWVGENHTASVPLALYGLILLMSAIAFYILQWAIIHYHDDDFALRKAIGKDLKGKLSLVLYVVGLLLSFVNPWFAISCYVFVAIMWFVPDKRIEKNIN